MQSNNRKEELKARKDGATLTKNSGRGMNKGDATYNGIYMLDYKFTEKASFSVNLKKFQALQKQAWHENQEPVIVVVFEEYGDRSVAIVDWELLKELLDQRSIIGEQ